MNKIAILIPCYNEEKTIGKVVSDYRCVLPSADIYVYDNNSTDNTAEIAHQGGQLYGMSTDRGRVMLFGACSATLKRIVI